MERVPVISEIADVIDSRKGGDPKVSYVAKLFSKAPDAALKKVGEEATEVVMAAKDGDRDHLIYETADLWFHSMVVLSQAGIQSAWLAWPAKSRWLPPPKTSRYLSGPARPAGAWR